MVVRELTESEKEVLLSTANKIKTLLEETKTALQPYFEHGVSEIKAAVRLVYSGTLDEPANEVEAPKES